LSDFNKEDLKAAVQAVVYPGNLEPIPKDREEAEDDGDFDESDHLIVNGDRWIPTHTIEDMQVMQRRFKNKQTGEPTNMVYYVDREGKRQKPSAYRPARALGQFRIEETTRKQLSRPLFTLCCQADDTGWQAEDLSGNVAEATTPGNVMLSLCNGEKYIVQLPLKMEVIATRIED
jgi:hypothetical protein